jgi:hypothetical protein
MIALGVLKRSASFFHTDSFEVWDSASSAFIPGFTGRIYPFDRFKTIYHRPTRREMLGVPVDFSPPASLVLRHPATGEEYIIGETKKMDTDRDIPYDHAYALHRVLRTLSVVRPTIQGSGDDLGALVPVVVGLLHADLELRTSEREQDAYEKFKGRFFVTMPNSIKVQKGDFLVGGSDSFRVEVAYLDGGFQMARADDVHDERETLTYFLPTGSGASLDPATGAYTKESTVPRLFSGIVSPVDNSEADHRPGLQQPEIRVFVEREHIGFEPEVGRLIERGSDRYEVHSVRIDPESDQWILACRRGA